MPLRRLFNTPNRINFRVVSALLTGLLLLPCFALPASALATSDIAAEAAVLMDAATGQVLFSKNMDQPMHPASITKIMTGLVAIEYCSPRETITVRESATKLPAGSSHIALSAGERLQMEDAIYALMLPSANDAANAIAEHVSGTQAAFAQLMNRRAAQLGCTHTHFTNAHGLTDENHLTTAYDMALITRAAIKSEDFMLYFGADRHTMGATNTAPQRPLTNYQYMLVSDTSFYNADVVAGKVGYTRLAGHTMSTVATRDGRTLICVVMNTGKDQKFYDTEKLLAFGFDDFAPLTVSRDSLRQEDISAADMRQGGGDPAALSFGHTSFNTAAPSGSVRTAAASYGTVPASPAAIYQGADITWFEAPAAAAMRIETASAGPASISLSRVLTDALIGLVLLLMACALAAIAVAARAILRDGKTA